MTDKERIINCELCGTPCKVVGKTTLHYEPVGLDEKLYEIQKLIFKYYPNCSDLKRTWDLAKAITNLSRGEG